MQPLITLRRRKDPDPKHTWALGFALTLESIAEYGEIYNAPGGRPDMDAPFSKALNAWTDTALWMGRDLTKLCGGRRVDVHLCLPRHLQHPADSEMVDGAGSEVPPVPQRPTAATAVPPDTTSSEPQTPDATPHDTQKKSNFSRKMRLIPVVAVAQIEADTILEAEQLLLRQCRDANKPYPLQRYWKTIKDRLTAPEASYPRLYQIW